MKKTRQIENNSKGFTLIELVLVIAVIILLAAIIVPRYASQSGQARIAATKANLESLRSWSALG